MLCLSGKRQPLSEQLDTLLCSTEKVPAFVLRNSKIHFTCKRAKIALKPSFCLLNYGLCQEPTQSHHYCSHLVYCFALQACFMAASERCQSPEVAVKVITSPSLVWFMYCIIQLQGRQLIQSIIFPLPQYIFSQCDHIPLNYTTS